MIKKSDIKDIYFLSPMQAGMLFHYLKDGDSPVYFEQMMYSIGGELDIPCFEQAFAQLVETHDVLRTIFVHEKVKQPVQAVLKKRKGVVYFRDLSTYSEGRRSDLVEDFKKEDQGKGFDLARDMPLRLTVLGLGPEKYLIIISFHHIILDGWSAAILYRDLIGIYKALKAGKPPSPVVVPRYKDYIEWLETRDRQKGLQYWRDYLDGYECPAVVPGLFTTGGGHEYKRRTYGFALDENRSLDLTRFAGKHSITPGTVFQVIWGILLGKYNHTNDVVFGLIVSGRPPDLEDVDSMVGLFVNNVPLRIMLQEDKPAARLAREVWQKEFSSKSYEYLPLADIQTNSPLKEKLIDHFMVIENYPIDRELENLNKDQELGLEIEDVQTFGQSNYDFVVMVCPGPSMRVEFKYNAAVHPDNLVRRMAAGFEELVLGFLDNPQIPIGELRRISGKREREILLHFNRDLREEAAPLLQEADTLQGQLDGIFRRYPDHGAVEYGERFITYRGLDEQSRAAAHWIIHQGIGRGTLIGVLLEDRLDLIVAVLGILRAGCVFVPLDSSNPAERIETIAASNEMKYMIMDEGNHRRFDGRDISGGHETTVLLFPALSGPSDPINGRRYHPEDRVYVYFTSGSTGTPKGVVGRNIGLLHFINWEIGAFNIDSRCRVSQFTIPSFDPYLRDIFVPLLSGGTVCIPPEKETLLDPGALVRWINDRRITLIHCVTGLFRLLNSACPGVGDFPELRVIALGGEKTHPSDLVSWYETFGERIQLVNFYGPTETTLVKIHYFINKDDVKRVRIPIGRPIKGAGVVILDEKLEVCDTLEAGEICIRTPYSSLGYYNDRELNRIKFIVNPLNNDPNDIIYRSGDLGRSLPDGTIDIIGRIDRQVKIRGHRVELEGIEQILINHPLVKEAAIIKKEMPNNIEILCGFIVTKENQGAEVDSGALPDDIKRYLWERLPEYMVPARIIEIENMPRKANGKIDFMKLSGFTRDEFMNHGENSMPHDHIEKRLGELWREILGIENISVTGHFFEIGGSSLNVMTLSARIHKEFNIKISLSELIAHPTIQQQAGIIRVATGEGSYRSIKKAEEKAYYPLTPSQVRLYAVQQMEPESTAYNLPHCFELEGNVEIRRLEETFKKLIRRHESLRTSFVLVEGEAMQRIHHQVEFKIENYDVRTHGFGRPFDLARAPLLRVGWARQGNNKDKYILMIDVHHIVTDGVSLVILVKELMRLYEGRELPAVNLQYRDYVQWRNRPWQEAGKNQENYWLREFEGIKHLEPLNLRPDHERPGKMCFAGDTLFFQMDKENVRALKALTLSQGAVMFTAWMAVYVIMLAKISGQNEFVVGTLAAGRGHADLENMIGMFVNTLALRCQYQGQQTFARYLAALNKKSLQAFENQDYPFEDLVRRVVDGRAPNRNPLFDVMFEFQDVGMRELKLPGMKLIPTKIEKRASKFDITLKCVETDDNYSFYLEYRTTLFKREKIERYAGYFKQIVNTVVENKNIKLEDIQITHEFSPSEIPRVQVEFDF